MYSVDENIVYCCIEVHGTKDEFSELRQASTYLANDDYTLAPVVTFLRLSNMNFGSQWSGKLSGH